mmetsp:Transcript_31045/g.58976  ORF Transcript_31045/g.58976 Transcript_31045/m.58976 type:complete len:96 (+) Transcript_31045:1359-1646(+)
MLKFSPMPGALPFLSTGPDPATMTIAGSSALSPSDDDVGRVRSPYNWHDGSDEGNVSSDLFLVSSVTFVMFYSFDFYGCLILWFIYYLCVGVLWH